MAKKAILICIYGDTSTTGFLGPIFPDKTFEGIPIQTGTPIGPTYQEIIGVHQVPISTYIPKITGVKIEAMSRAHFDPDPIHLTYGDNGDSKVANVCRNLNPGDLLLWSARLCDYNEGYLDRFPKVYLIGWLMVEHIIDGTLTTGKDLLQVFRNRNINNHLLLSSIDQDGNDLYDLKKFSINLENEKHVIVCGNKAFGGQLEKAIPLTDPIVAGNYPISSEMSDLFRTAKKILRIGPYNLNYDVAWNLVNDKTLNNPKLPLKWL